MSLLHAISEFQVKELKKTTTRITTRDGKVYEERPSNALDNREKVFIFQGPVPDYIENVEAGESKLNAKIFRDGLWQPCVESRCEESSLDSLKFVTYNVWFSEKNWENRANALFNVIRETNPDLVCFQEVTPHFLSKLLKISWIQQSYFVADSSFASVIPYGVFMISKIPFVNIMLHDLPTNMGRRFLLAEFSLNNSSFYVGTVHLESMGNTQIRMMQLRAIQEMTMSYDNVIVMGDFNFSFGMPENALIEASPDWIDTWERANTEAARSEYTCKGFIIDRVIHKGGLLVPISINRIGTLPSASVADLSSTELPLPAPLLSVAIEKTTLSEVEHEFGNVETQGQSITMELSGKEINKQERWRDFADELYPSDHDGVCSSFIVKLP